MPLDNKKKLLIGGGLLALIAIGVIVWMLMKKKSSTNASVGANASSSSSSNANSSPSQVPSYVSAVGGSNQVVSGSTNTMNSGDYLLPGSSINSSSTMSTSTNALVLSLSSAGKLCLVSTDPTTGYTLCAPGVNTPGAALVMQPSGNLVLVDSSGNVLWQTGSNSPGATLKLQTDGNLVIYKAGTATSASPVPVWAQAQLGSSNTLVPSS